MNFISLGLLAIYDAITRLVQLYACSFFFMISSTDINLIMFVPSIGYANTPSMVDIALIKSSCVISGKFGIMG